MGYPDQRDTEELLKLARAGDMDAAIELVERVKHADYLCNSRDRDALHFRLGVMPQDVAKIRNTADRIRNQLREMFRLMPIYKAVRMMI